MPFGGSIARDTLRTREAVHTTPAPSRDRLSVVPRDCRRRGLLHQRRLDDRRRRQIDLHRITLWPRPAMRMRRWAGMYDRRNGLALLCDSEARAPRRGLYDAGLCRRFGLHLYKERNSQRRSLRGVLQGRYGLSERIDVLAPRVRRNGRRSAGHALQRRLRSCREHRLLRLGHGVHHRARVERRHALVRPMRLTQRHGDARQYVLGECALRSGPHLRAVANRDVDVFRLLHDRRERRVQRRFEVRRVRYARRDRQHDLRRLPVRTPSITSKNTKHQRHVGDEKRAALTRPT